MRILLLLFLLHTTLGGASQFGTEPVLATDMLKIKSLSGVTISKDGSRALFTVTSIEPDAKNKQEYKYVTQVWLIATDGKTPARQLTRDENASQPAWSPDGSQVAFVRVVDQRPQVFILRFDGSEPRQLTKSRFGAGSPKWSPDGRHILFTASLSLNELLNDSTLNPGNELPSWSTEKPGFDSNDFLKAKPGVQADPDGSLEEVRAWLESNVTDKKARVINRLNFQDESDINPDMNFTRYFLISTEGNEEAKGLSRGFGRYGGAEFSPDGKRIYFSGNLEPGMHPDRVQETGIYVMELESGITQKLYGEKGKTFSTPLLSPSGKWMAFQHGTTSFVHVPTLAIAPANGGTYRDIIHDRGKGNLAWTADEKFLYYTAASNGAVPIFRAEVASGKVEQITDMQSGVPSFDIAGEKLLYVKTEVANPFELYLGDKMGKPARQVSRFNAEWLATKKISFPQKHSFINERGLEVEYWVMKPSNPQPGRPYPLLLEIHGGPSSMWGPGEASMWHEYQYFCSRGYGLVYSNPRGSGGYGTTFLRANIDDWSRGPAKDVMQVLDLAMAQGGADSTRMFITGGSYAGYLVSWIIAHHQRFRAACVQRGVYDLATFFGEGNAWRLVPNYFGGYPWEVKATLDRESPINYVDRIQTPLIIFHGDNDRRTGFVQSEMLYRSLKVLGRPVEYVRHPNATHEITRSGNNRQRLDQLIRTWEFFERWSR